MGTTAEKLQKILNTKNAIKTSIVNKGGNIDDNTVFSEYAGAIDNLQTGIVPSGNINITNTNQVDVTNYATAQVVDSNLVAENILENISILGVIGTAKAVKEVTELPTASAENVNDLVIYNGELYICKEV